MESVEAKLQKRTIFTFITVAVVSCVLFIHVAIWDQHFLAIIPIKVMKTMGIANASQLKNLAEMCQDRMLPSCREEALEDLLTRKPDDLAVMEQLAKLKDLLDKDNEALQLYKSYFSKGGQSAEVAYKIARLFEKNASYSEAEEYYLLALKKKPDVLQISVNEAYVRMLINTGALTKAQRHIETLRKNGAPNYFLSTEYSEIKAKLKKKS